MLATTETSSLVPKNLALADRREAAALLGTTERHIRRLTAERRLPYVKVGGKVRFRVSDLVDFIDRQVVPNEVQGSIIDVVRSADEA